MTCLHYQGVKVLLNMNSWKYKYVLGYFFLTGFYGGISLYMGPPQKPGSLLEGNDASFVSRIILIVLYLCTDVPSQFIYTFLFC